MSITTFQKVTLVSCIVLCVSLFLPKMMLYGVKKEMMQKTGKEMIHPASPDVPSHFPAFPDHSFDVGSCCLTHLFNNLPSPMSLKFQKSVTLFHLKIQWKLVTVPSCPPFHTHTQRKCRLHFIHCTDMVGCPGFIFMMFIFDTTRITPFVYILQ